MLCVSMPVVTKQNMFTLRSRPALSRREVLRHSHFRGSYRDAVLRFDEKRTTSHGQLCCFRLHTMEQAKEFRHSHTKREITRLTHLDAEDSVQPHALRAIDQEFGRAFQEIVSRHLVGSKKNYFARIGSLIDARAADVILRLICAQGRVVRLEARTRSSCEYDGVESEVDKCKLSIEYITKFRRFQ